MTLLNKARKQYATYQAFQQDHPDLLARLQAAYYWRQHPDQAWAYGHLETEFVLMPKEDASKVLDSYYKLLDQERPLPPPDWSTWLTQQIGRYYDAGVATVQGGYYGAKQGGSLLTELIADATRAREMYGVYQDNAHLMDSNFYKLYQNYAKRSHLKAHPQEAKLCANHSDKELVWVKVPIKYQQTLINTLQQRQAPVKLSIWQRGWQALKNLGNKLKYRILGANKQSLPEKQIDLAEQFSVQQQSDPLAQLKEHATLVQHYSSDFKNAAMETAQQYGSNVLTLLEQVAEFSPDLSEQIYEQIEKFGKPYAQSLVDYLENGEPIPTQKITEVLAATKEYGTGFAKALINAKYSAAPYLNSLLENVSPNGPAVNYGVTAVGYLGTAAGYGAAAVGYGAAAVKESYDNITTNIYGSSESASATEVFFDAQEELEPVFYEAQEELQVQEEPEFFDAQEEPEFNAPAKEPKPQKATYTIMHQSLKTTEAVTQDSKQDNSSPERTADKTKRP
jgi:outer membrane lipopolysaccharide assembly protein LptE/RlpB